ncbi:YkgJ family cysteine cluster protein [Sulfurimonas lithotrophica]|uniref:YkgJ family cysteine cluster protein n=1 Tax=Sulfurimonas lithotrophica TaxID=2590022 RepID=A0A5P8P238_9BACT|nr:YkgJ family cysteine cluster protein [Sulfurimonas lithotrophica]QFR49691.1 YkgJ family cysteine cluster protein [Sulfurimonas lithotrophica]
MSVIKQDGFDFTFNPEACNECEARCCRGESGYIYVNKTEATAICDFLDIDMKELIDKYLYKKSYKYSIKERKIGENYECVFYDEKINGCGIYEARPTQCRTFPFWDYFKTRIDELKDECPGII